MLSTEGPSIADILHQTYESVQEQVKAVLLNLKVSHEKMMQPNLSRLSTIYSDYTLKLAEYRKNFFRAYFIARNFLR